jgi:hypothetical protein
MKNLITIISLAALSMSAFAQITQTSEQTRTKRSNVSMYFSESNETLALQSEPLAIRSNNWSKKRKSQFQAQSLSVKPSSDGVSVLWLRDGLSTNYTAFSVPLFQVTGLGNRVSIVALGAYDSNFSKTNVWAGTGLSVSLVENSGWSVKAYGGWKGFNLGDNFKAAQGKESFVYGLGFSVPIR